MLFDLIKEWEKLFLITTRYSVRSFFFLVVTLGLLCLLNHAEHIGLLGQSKQG